MCMIYTNIFPPLLESYMYENFHFLKSKIKFNLFLHIFWLNGNFCPDFELPAAFPAAPSKKKHQLISCLSMKYKSQY